MKSRKPFFSLGVIGSSYLVGPGSSPCLSANASVSAAVSAPVGCFGNRKKVLPYFFSVPLACSAFSAFLMASLDGRVGGAFLKVSQVLAYLPTPPQTIPLPSLLRQP